ncbi:MAG TPA: hypothetical protein VJL54_04835, partial [Nitrososphaera sp.]|nr:hypothetical protein [Nitrososphaera sp.]
MAVRGLDNPPSKDDRSRKNKRNRILLASLAVLALLSLFVLLGNPGLWTPDERDEPEAEATDGTGDSNNTGSEPATNSSSIVTIVTITNDTSSNNGGFVQNNSDDGSNRNPDGSGYVISYGGPKINSTSGSGGGG